MLRAHVRHAPDFRAARHAGLQRHLIETPIEPRIQPARGAVRAADVERRGLAHIHRHRGDRAVGEAIHIERERACRRRRAIISERDVVPRSDRNRRADGFIQETRRAVFADLQRVAVRGKIELQFRIGAEAIAHAEMENDVVRRAARALHPRGETPVRVVVIEVRARERVADSCRARRGFIETQRLRAEWRSRDDIRSVGIFAADSCDFERARAVEIREVAGFRIRRDIRRLEVVEEKHPRSEGLIARDDLK